MTDKPAPKPEAKSAAKPAKATERPIDMPGDLKGDVTRPDNARHTGNAEEESPAFALQEQGREPVPEPGTGGDPSQKVGRPGKNVVENSHGPNPIGLKPNAPLDKDDPNVGSPTLSTVTGEDVSFDSSQPMSPHERLNAEIAAGDNNPANDTPLPKSLQDVPGATEGPRDGKPYVDRPDPEDPEAPHNAAGPSGDYDRSTDEDIDKSERSTKSKY